MSLPLVGRRYVTTHSAPLTGTWVTIAEVPIKKVWVIYQYGALVVSGAIGVTEISLLSKEGIRSYIPAWNDTGFKQIFFAQAQHKNDTPFVAQPGTKLQTYQSSLTTAGSYEWTVNLLEYEAPA